MPLPTRTKPKLKLWAILVWLLLWAAAAHSIGEDILLVSPLKVLQRLLELVQHGAFWLTIGRTLLRLGAGFLLALVSGVLFGVLAAFFRPLRDLLAPFVVTIRSVPVASFVILLLVWFTSRNLSIVISFLMVFPILYQHVLDGILHADRRLVEMADIFEWPLLTRLRYLYFSEVLPGFRTGCSLALGLCWKAGIAAEVIGLPNGSIGERLYEAKIYLDTDSLFAWTVVIICLSWFFEKALVFLLSRATRRWEGIV